MEPTGSELSDLARLTVHEFNNILNNISLQLAVMEQKGVPDELHPDIAVIRQATRNAATMVKQLQQFSPRKQGPLGTADLNAVVRDIASRDRGPLLVTLQLAPSLPRVQAGQGDLERLVELLLGSAAAAIGPDGGTIVFRTEALPDRVHLHMTDTGPPVNPEDLRRFFQPFAILRHGSDGIAPALCKGIVRRIQGTIHAENLSGGGMAIAVELRPAADDSV